MIDISIRIREFFEKAQGNIDLPNCWRFPTGACEGTSLFLGEMLHELFPKADVTYIKGYKPCGEMHFWLSIDGLIYDLTADQFPEVDSPIFGAKVQPLEVLFNKLEKQPIKEAFKNSDVTTEAYKHGLMLELRYFLTGYV